MRKRRHFSIRHFRCPECGAVFPVSKMVRRTGGGHIKTMYCYKCRAERDFEQIDIDTTKQG